ncbi:MAG: fibronectin type III domain-containing protein, partial [Planctomycetaceae bacterium]|nr:fibronectin type III domain-containing protein [Planctomycetaceae bacterium]
APGYMDSAASLVVGETTLKRFDRPVLTVDTAATTSTSITVKWNAVPGAKTYLLEWKLASDNGANPTWITINIPGTAYTEFFYTFNLLSANTRYHFRLTAKAPGYMDSAASLVVGETTLIS